MGCCGKQSVCSLSSEGCYGGGVYTGDTLNYASVANTSHHKSFDLSDVAINGAGKDGNFRQFHQTRIFVNKFSGMLNHGEEQGDGTYLITANLPDQVQYGIGSQWEAPLSGFGSPGIWNAILQMASGSGLLGKYSQDLSSGINRLTSVKVWSGTNPFKLTITIPVLDDSYYCGCTDRYKTTNLTECLEFLGSLCLPKTSGKYGFYVPPPSPLQYTFTWGEGKSVNFNPTQGYITLQLGGMFMLDNCILEQVNVTYPNTKALIRKYANSGSSRLVPLLANVTLTFSTIEALTSKTYSKMLWLLNQKNMGNFSTDASGIFEWAKDTFNTFIGKSDGNVAESVGQDTTTSAAGDLTRTLSSVGQ
ncbi:MAG: hypothetical protein IKO49_02020 [Bacilli bacterium]|nr:hypothetical protein [Clostridia bacterium]MBR4618057.1 hypothetical protein [Bacilli bacterium]